MGSRDDRFWAEFFGVAVADWDAPGVSVRPHAGLAGYRGLWCFRRQDRTVVSAPPGWVTHLTRVFEGCDQDRLLSESYLRKVLAADFQRFIGPAFQGCLEAGRFRRDSGTRVRWVESGDARAVSEFRAAFGADDWESGGLDQVEEHRVAYFMDRRVVAMAGYRPRSDEAGDPCVLVHTGFRGSGCGTEVVSAVVARALEQKKILLYQTLEANQAAVRIALKLGFDQYARHVAVRLEQDQRGPG